MALERCALAGCKRFINRTDPDRVRYIDPTDTTKAYCSHEHVEAAAIQDALNPKEKKTVISQDKETKKGAGPKENKSAKPAEEKKTGDKKKGDKDKDAKSAKPAPADKKKADAPKGDKKKVAEKKDKKTAKPAADDKGENLLKEGTRQRKVYDYLVKKGKAVAISELAEKFECTFIPRVIDRINEAGARQGTFEVIRPERGMVEIKIKGAKKAA